jgi:hypothetical protein
MTTTNVTTWHLQAILEGLEDALKVTRDAEVLNEHGHPYCHGYLDACVSNVVYELKALIEQK